MGVVTWAWLSLLRISEVKGRNTCYQGESPLQTVILLPGEFPYRLKTFQEKSRTRFVLTKKKKKSSTYNSDSNQKMIMSEY